MRFLKPRFGSGTRGSAVEAVAPDGSTPAMDAPPESVLACPAQSGAPVPPGFFGLRVAPGLAESRPVPAGQTLQQHKGDPVGTRLWWLRDAPWVIRFAPQPSAPEAGLQLALRPVVDTGEASVKLLRWLESQAAGADITRQELAGIWQEEAVFRTLPPCAGPRVLAERQAWLDEHLFLCMGCRMEGLSRCDLYPGTTTLAPPQASSLPASEGAATAAADGENRSAPCDLAPVPACNEAPVDEEPWPAVLAKDKQACARLREELPELAAGLRNAWAPVASWPTSMDSMLRQRDTLNLLQLLANGVRLMPRLDRQASGPGAVTMAERRQIATEARHAEHALSEVWQCLLHLPQGVAPSATQLDELALAVGRLSVATRRRQDAWWTLRPDRRRGPASERDPQATGPR